MRIASNQRNPVNLFGNEHVFNTKPPCPCPAHHPQVGPSGMRIADVLDGINAQASVRVTERDLRLALNERVRRVAEVWQRWGHASWRREQGRR